MLLPNPSSGGQKVEGGGRAGWLEFGVGGGGMEGRGEGWRKSKQHGIFTLYSIYTQFFTTVV
jgi:hypothetical protein